ncbi:RNA 2',3'-cyclic phosphodiesterase [Sporosarcina pasteurii]|uniref:RNA 2',3'-cyclic phosphodiesterase n=1 Tax=Sporosarcina pasteurii TaxID=1474 RepID=A0A380BY47_SPOPA|nr:RNA 2',3'-cyclic phosphodiesterase [Sporosarcina pasteurii]MDS9471379.1 RNA 2',3'-cyclic phosphodiesterase [Sporosarcina pasteurii]SUJ08228.1 2'-5' RNA ligase [Sporosarcina pasteurii]
MKRHYFIGIPIPTQVAKIAEEFQKEYSLHKTYKVLTHEEDLHVTLLYLGAVEEQQLPAVKNQLAEIAKKTASLSLSINGLSYFGAKNGPRVVYLAVSDNHSLTKLQREINATIPSLLGMPKTDRFVPHVTIAKKRKTQESQIIEKQPFNPIDISVPSFSLFTIHPEKSPKYEAIATFTLR